MNKIIFTEEFCQPENLHPFTLTRQIQDIRVGILTIREKWEKMLKLPSFDRKEDDYKDLDRSLSLEEAASDDGFCLMVHGNVLPTPDLIKAVRKLKDGEFIASKDSSAIVYRFTRNQIRDKFKVQVTRAVLFEKPVTTINYPWEIFQLNDFAIRQDFKLLTDRRKTVAPSRTNKIIAPRNLFIEKGARVEHAVINASTGPVYIGRNAEVMEGCVIRGPFAMGEGACLKMGTKVYGATTLGPHSVVAGEIKNSVLFGYSNKAHDGYLGDSVVGEWCNISHG